MWGVGVVSSTEIDKINILEATKEAMILAIKDLEKRNNVKADYLILDGKMALNFPVTQVSIIKGDDRIFSCAAASIVAKFVRDQLMLKMDEKYPEYNFKKHKGYGTREHLLNIEKHGICPIHRKSFRPIKKD
jgi:ribonuclease HII